MIFMLWRMNTNRKWSNNKIMKNQQMEVFENKVYFMTKNGRLQQSKVLLREQKVNGREKMIREWQKVILKL